VPVRHERSRRIIGTKISVLDRPERIAQDALNIRTGRPGVGFLVVQRRVLIRSDRERAAILQPQNRTQLKTERPVSRTSETRSPSRAEKASVSWGRS
jgi:hypothetical protein